MYFNIEMYLRQGDLSCRDTYYWSVPSSQVLLYIQPTVCLFQAMASTEDKAYEIMQELDVDYVLVIFGGLAGYSSDGL